MEDAVWEVIDIDPGRFEATPRLSGRIVAAFVRKIPGIRES
jgi:hypothetical protein